MFEFKKTIFINHPHQAVFDFVTDPTNDPKWRESAISAEWTTPGPIRVGATIRSVDKFIGREIDSINEVAVWDPPNEFGLKSTSESMPFTMTMKFDAKEGGTQLTMFGQAEIAGFFKLAEGLVGKQMEKQIDKDLNGLKRYLEGS